MEPEFVDIHNQFNFSKCGRETIFGMGKETHILLW